MSKKPIILVIDHSEFHLEFVKEFLGKTDIVLTASSTEKGLKSLKHTLPHLILLELNMPVMDGFAFLTHIQKIIKQHHIPVLAFISQNIERHQKLKLISLGCYDFITKPFDIVELELRVKNALAFKTYQEYLEDMVAEKTKQLKEAYRKLQKTNQQLKAAHLKLSIFWER